MREIQLSELETASRLTLEKAQKAIAGGYFHYARSLLLSLLEHYPNCPQLRLMLRQTVIVIHEHQEPMLVAQLKTLLWEAYYALKNSPLRHLNRLERVLTRVPDCVAAHRAFAKVAIEREMWATAALSLESVVTLDPQRSAHEQVLLAQAYLKQGRSEEAQGIIRAVLDKNPHNDFASELLKQAAIEQTLQKEPWKS